MLTFRGRPPRGLCLAGGIIGPTIAHCSSVRSEGYFFRDWFLCTIHAHSSTKGICANYLINLLFCQDIFPDSLLVERRVDGWCNSVGRSGPLTGEVWCAISESKRAAHARNSAPHPLRRLTSCRGP